MSFILNGYEFEGTWTNTQSIQARAGVYVVYCKSGETWTLLDVGEAGDVRNRLDNHDRADCWRRNCTGTFQYGVHYTPGLQQPARIQIEQTIRRANRVLCGER